MMPRMDGFDVIEHIRADANLRDLPIIVISAKDLTTDETLRLKQTVNSVMKKQGFESEKFIGEINTILHDLEKH
jgi:CheY-like chemotaxis protein